jgi:prepilin-type N-terminal cleavage/methylation domain-containing protein
MNHKSQSGFTLVEVAIVLVIVGLLLGGILKGQELVSNARVRNVADQQNAVKAAYYAFQDRYRALPGDYNQASTNIPNVAAAANGNGDAQILGNEVVLAWYHLTQAGFISCSQCSNAPGAGAVVPAAGNSPLNAFGGVMQINFDGQYATPGVVLPAPAPSAVNSLKSGTQIPSNLLAEIDRKIDDGNPETGTFRFSDVNPGGAGALGAAVCYTPTAGAVAAFWQSATPNTNCGAAYLF